MKEKWAARPGGPRKRAHKKTKNESHRKIKAQERTSLYTIREKSGGGGGR